MSAFVRQLMRTGNATAVFLYRRSGGRILKTAGAGMPVLLLTVPGRSTGIPRTVPVSYFVDGGRYVVTGTAGGSPEEPQWFRNLRAASRARIEIGTLSREVTVEVPEGAERDRLWRDVVVARAPAFAKYEAKSGRAIGVGVLTPA